MPAIASSGNANFFSLGTPCENIKRDKAGELRYLPIAGDLVPVEQREAP